MNHAAFQQCINPACGDHLRHRADHRRLHCNCGSLLDIRYDWDQLPRIKSLNFFEHRWSTKGTDSRRAG